MKRFKFNGIYKTKNYFEGWYTRIYDKDQNLSYAFIFGISLYKRSPHAFIQIVDSTKEIAEYHRFNIDDFYYNKSSVRIKDNILSPNYLKIKVNNFEIELDITNHVLLQNTGAMSFIKYLPMCAYHEVILMDAKARGTIVKENNKLNFNGIAYMEKNWGNKFPKKWIWVQSNNFDKENCSFVCGVAELYIPKLIGFFCILNINGVEHRFATYNGYKLSLKTNDKKIIEYDIYNDKNRLNVKINYNNESLVIAPVKNGKMKKINGESIDSNLKLTLYQNKKIMFSGNATYISCENLFVK